MRAAQLRWGVRVLLAAMFAYAAYGKLLDPDAFATDIDNYRMMPRFVAERLAAVLPMVELAVAAGLITRWFGRGSALLSAAMLWAFAVAMVQAQLRGIDLDCGCFGAAASTEVGVGTIVRNACLGAVACWIALSRDEPADATTETRPTPVRHENPTP